MGQCSKIVHLKEPFKGFEMSSKRIFDDMYLFLKQANENAGKNIHSIDEMSGLPNQSYEDVISQYWNLIYKNPIHVGTQENSSAGYGQYGQNANRAQSLNIVGIEKEYQESARKNLQKTIAD